jgi:epoxyqueuosine reductase QueG
MKEALRQRARELGFDDCRVTTANAPESAARFKQWLAEGRQGEMAWLERNGSKRVDPQQVLPGARSIIALAASYRDSNCSTAPAAGNCSTQSETSPSGQAATQTGAGNRQSPIANPASSRATPATVITTISWASA